MTRILIGGLTLILATSSWLVGESVARRGPALPPKESQPLSLEEAKILVYLVPEAEQVRKAGCDVTAALQTNPKLDQTNFFTFWLIRSGTNKECNTWPVDISYFSVNKWTGDIWDDIPKPHRISSPTLDGVLEIIRREKGISETTIRKYGSLKPPI